MTIEAREHARYRMKDGTLAGLSVPGRLELTIGQVLDISEKGLAFKHTDEITIAPSRAEILLLGHEQSEVSEVRIPAKFVYKHDLEEGFRSGFEFGDLSRDQATRLASFIRSNTESAVP